jgi:antitoxin component YwqK of YwqJK toxin-antitoxin module
MKNLYYCLLLCSVFIYSCTEATKPAEQKPIQQDTLQTDFMFSVKSDTVIQNGEYIAHYKNGVVEMTGQMKDGKRDGVWKSYYTDGSPWSETVFEAGIKNGKTITWFDNEQKRYEGFYKDGKESGKWTFWDERGKQERVKVYN